MELMFCALMPIDRSENSCLNYITGFFWAKPVVNSFLRVLVNHEYI